MYIKGKKQHLKKKFFIQQASWAALFKKFKKLMILAVDANSPAWQIAPFLWLLEQCEVMRYVCTRKILYVSFIKQRGKPKMFFYLRHPS